jgi:hypothetical protein
MKGGIKKKTQLKNDLKKKSEEWGPNLIN